jgi:Secretion system C-terminal sorting domain
MMTGTTIFSSAVNEDCAVLRWIDGSVTGIETLPTAVAPQLYPNPITGNYVAIAAKNLEKKKVNITLTDAIGRVVLNNDVLFKDDVYLLNVADINVNGFYLLTLRAEHEMPITRSIVIKQR